MSILKLGYFCLQNGVIMKKLLVLAAVTVFFLAACSSSKHQLLGTWKVSKVETNFKNTNLPKAVVEHIKDEQKQLSFKIVSDSVMVLILDNNTHEARWKMDPKTKVIKYYFKNKENSVYKLGTWDGNNITTQSNTPLGDITIIFKKEPGK